LTGSRAKHTTAILLQMLLVAARKRAGAKMLFPTTTGAAKH